METPNCSTHVKKINMSKLIIAWLEVKKEDAKLWNMRRWRVGRCGVVNLSR